MMPGHSHGMDVVIACVDPATQPDLLSWVQAHHDETAPTAPPESRHTLSAGELTSPGVRLWLARDADGRIVGSVALSPVEPGHEELKSMRVEPLARGKGLGGALLDAAVADARARHVVRMSLETGSDPFFAPAWAVYRSRGFTDCGPFGGYVEDPYSIFLTLALDP